MDPPAPEQASSDIVLVSDERVEECESDLTLQAYRSAF
jgi:hypothetical protein